MFIKKEKMESSSKKKPTLGFSLLVILVLCVFVYLGVGPLNLNIALLLFLSWIVIAPFAAYLGYSFHDLEGFAYDMAKSALPPAAIIMSVGIMIATWLAGGTVPTVLVVGLKLITPKLFLLVTFVLCSLVSILMGTSWGTAGTAGVAMMGVGLSMGMSPGIVAGAVISGAYFGDKMSPMSDSTNICATVTKTDLMTHIKYMSISSIPAFIISAILYTIVGMVKGGTNYDPSQVDSIITNLNAVFKIDFISVIPIILVLAMLFMKKSVVVSLLVGAISAGVIAVVHQGFPIASVGTFMMNGFKIETEDAILRSLLNRGGMTSMLTLVATFIGALGLGGMMNKTGLIQPLLDALTRRVRSGKSLIITTMVLTWILVTVIATNNFAFAMLGTLLPSLFRKYNLKSENLSRALEDCGTLGNVLVPWSVGAMFMTGTLGVTSSLDYLPWAFQNYITPLVTIVMVLTGFRIAKVDPTRDLSPLSDSELALLAEETGEEGHGV